MEESKEKEINEKPIDESEKKEITENKDSESKEAKETKESEEKLKQEVKKVSTPTNQKESSGLSAVAIVFLISLALILMLSILK